LLHIIDTSTKIFPRVFQISKLMQVYSVEFKSCVRNKLCHIL